MAFPTPSTPRFGLTVPSTGEKVSFRPFLVGEQKGMMLSLASGDTDTIVGSIRHIINVCSDGKLDASKLAPFDIEDIFLKLRIQSIGESIDLTGTCTSCESEFQFSVDLTTATLDLSDIPSNKISINDSIGVIMRWPSPEVIFEMHQKDELTEADLIEVVTDSIDSVWDADDVFKADDYPRDDRVKFIEALTQEQLQRLTAFVVSTPSTVIDTTARCPNCKTDNKIHIEGLESFFV